MNDKSVMTITVPSDIPALFAEIAGGERKKGEWLTSTLRSIKSGQSVPGANDIDTLQLQIVGLLAKVNALETKVNGLQAQSA